MVCCYLIIPSNGKIELFIDSFKIEHLLNDLTKLVNFNSFKNINAYILSIDKKKIVGLDEKSTPYYFKKFCKNKGLIVNHFDNPCVYLKAIKNKTEISGAKDANLRDGVSITKFIFWIKNKMKIKETDEQKAAAYLLKLRKKNYLFYSLSFETISAFSSNSALPHYRVTKDSNLKFRNNSIYLVDSGAQYKDGTTDITRTVIIGNATSEQKDRFTRVLKRSYCYCY